MLSTLLGSFRQPKQTVFDQDSSRRRHMRRDRDRCVSMVDGNMFPVLDWSLGGAQIACDEKRFGIGDEVTLALKFELRDDIIDVPHKAHVVRKGRGRVAFEFEPLSKDIRALFQTVMDDFMAREFAESQTV